MAQLYVCISEKDGTCKPVFYSVSLYKAKNDLKIHALSLLPESEQKKEIKTFNYSLENEKGLLCRFADDKCRSIEIISIEQGYFSNSEIIVEKVYITATPTLIEMKQQKELSEASEEANEHKEVQVGGRDELIQELKRVCKSRLEKDSEEIPRAPTPPSSLSDESENIHTVLPNLFSPEVIAGTSSPVAGEPQYTEMQDIGQEVHEKLKSEGWF